MAVCFSSGSDVSLRESLWRLPPLVLCGAWLVATTSTPAVSVAQSGARPGAHSEVDLSRFAHADDCQSCHNNLVSPAGQDVSIGTAWRATMMANSSRDPYWQAAVRRETLDHPSHAATIEDECGGCHMPMSTQIARAAGGKGSVFTHLPVARPQRDPLGRLAADGVSCTVCHQMAPEGLGTRERFNGRFLITPPTRAGVRQIYGPFEVDAGRKTIMRSVTGYEQVQARHISESEMCASCHTLVTNAIGPNGDLIGSLPEQMNYPEWRHSAFPDEGKSCQFCHMPAVAGPVRVSSVLGDGRARLSRHALVGGNAHMLRILNRFRDELGVTAASQEIEATAMATIRQLEQDTAIVSVTAARWEGRQLSFDVNVRNSTGHKFPTGFPSRRAWLHVVVTDDRGNRAFESGAVDDSGAIVGNDGDLSRTAFEPHYETITRADEVQIYEPVLGDRWGVPTTGLLTATQYLKDNRLLPRGFDKGTAAAEIAVHGGARDDVSFTGAGDRVQFHVVAAQGRGYEVDVELRYQSIGYRWAQSLEPYDAVEPRRFASYYQATSAGSSVVVARASIRVDSADSADR